MIGFIVDLDFVWGFQARVVGLSKTSPSFTYPPPTTFLGALAESIAKKHALGESVGAKLLPLFGEKLLALAIKPLNCFPIKYSDLNKVIAVKVTSGVHYPDPSNLARSFDSPARGKTVVVSHHGAPSIRWAVVFKDDVLTVEGHEIKLEEGCFWGIHRLGSKESLVSILDVKRVEEPETKEGNIVVKFSFPVQNGVEPLEELSGRWSYEAYVNPRSIKYSLKGNIFTGYMSGENLIPYRIPILSTAESPKFWVKVSPPMVAYKLEEDFVIGWRG